MSRLPVLFVGHGNPMHAIDDSPFARALEALGRRLPRPRAVLCVSAHWLTEGTWVTGQASPRTIHDFHGFPDELFAVRWPAPGSPATARIVRETITEPEIHVDQELWGFDHGCWAPLRRLFPDADVPTIQLSVYLEQPGSYHLSLGRALAPLRDRGVLVIASGNVVHNLPRLDWSPEAPPFDWALAFDAHVKRLTESGDAEALAGDWRRMPGGAESVPAPDHWWPYLYALGAADGDRPRWEWEEIENGSISMRCASFGLS